MSTVYSEMHAGNIVLQRKPSETHRRAVQIGFVSNANRQHVTCLGLASPDLRLLFFIILYSPVPEDQRKPTENRRKAVQVGIVRNSIM